MLRKLRKDNGMTLKTVADMLGISAMQLSRIERGENILRVEYAKKLGELFKTPWYLFYQESNDNR